MPSTPPPEDQQYDILWALASRTPTDPEGNSDEPGSCKRLLGAPAPYTFTRKTCKSEQVQSFVPTLKAPRYVDVRFDSRPTVLASRGLGVEIQLLYTGVLRPAFASIEYMLTLPFSPGLIPVPIYTGEEVDELECPGLNFFPIPPEALLRPIGNISSLDEALVLGVRIHFNKGWAARRLHLPSISAVGLRVTRGKSYTA